MSLDFDRLQKAHRTAIESLLAARNVAGHWEGELSTSALATATAVMALFQWSTRAQGSAVSRQVLACRALIERGCVWLLANQNADGGWGDTSKSFSNISTTMLCHATLVATRTQGGDASITTLSQNQIVTREEAIQRAADAIKNAGGIPALIARYGKDKTFSAPILTHCAIAGLVPWSTVPRLPFELACIPARWYAVARLPVVSYALPALIAIGQVRQHFAPTWNPITGALRWLARDRALQVLNQIQPPHGGFLEAAPLTSFVCMSLAAMGQTELPAVKRGIDFLMKSVRADGSWPIDTNLATWVTTLAVNALEDDLPAPERPMILNWLLDQQYQVTHPYTNAAPGGWAWTDLPGGVPDADDTPGAILAVQRLENRDEGQKPDQGAAGSDQLEEAPRWPPGGFPLGTHPATSQCLSASVVDAAIENGIRWLINLQNRDGGFPTFCRGWGKLPFDRSSPDITAHCLRAIHAWLNPPKPEDDPDLMWVYGLDDLQHRALEAIRRGETFLENVQRPDGSWLPLWFGNQHVPDDENPVYGTSRVLRAFSDQAATDPGAWTISAQRGVDWLYSVQNSDGGWGGDKGAPSTVEETALALEALLDAPQSLTTNSQRSILNPQLVHGIDYLIQRVEDGTWTEPTPIGFYFAKLWYFETLYPQVWTVSALRKAWKTLSGSP
ncbi:MAG: squalene--hopene cyclase [Planctomycetota bacterium]|nr:MAG: squalene--hopene cyclase [Planctomycetota bacterium]